MGGRSGDWALTSGNPLRNAPILQGTIPAIAVEFRCQKGARRQWFKLRMVAAVQPLRRLLRNAANYSFPERQQLKDVERPLCSMAC